MATSLQLFSKVDLQTVMKAGRWSHGGTFTSFNLRNLCPQAYSLRKTRPLVAAGGLISLPVFFCLSLLFYTVSYYRGNLVGPSLLLFKGGGGGGGPNVPQGDSCPDKYCLWESHSVYHLGVRSNRLSSLFCQILYNPNCHNYSNYL